MAGYCYLRGVRFEILAVVLALLLVKFKYREGCSTGVSVSCMMAYDEGGAPAVFDSGECLQWLLSASSLPNQTANCQFSQLQGRRKHQEDRISCDLYLKIPLPGQNGLKEVTVGIVGVFDGHGGKEASEMASNRLLDYFYLHSVFKMYKLMVQYKGEVESESLQLELLKEALLNTIHDIDAKFTQEALENNFFSGSTTTIIVMFNGQILVANVGDSKALLFSEKIQSSQGPEALLLAIELTKDHHPDRDDERARIEAAGGSVITWGVPRVNGVLAMSRSIGDVYLKRYGVIAEPECTGWQPLTVNDKYLMVASDGIFESLTSNDVRDHILEWESHDRSSVSLAEFIVSTAYEKGSTDNLSAIVIPLR